MYSETLIHIDKINAKDHATFHLLYKKFYKALVSYGITITENQLAAEDVVQEAFAHIWEKDVAFNDNTHLKTFLYNYVRNKCIDIIRHQKVETNFAKKVTKEHQEHPEYNVDDNGNENFFPEEIYRQLFEMIDHLPNRQREVFLLYMQGKSNLEIANALGVGIETVKTQKKRGKAFLKKNLSEDAWFMLCLILLH